MTDLHQLIQSGSAHVWLYIPVAILLGALHGLEPGHSKTMMAAFIIAVRGTIGQAVLLGLSAAISHSLIIWLLAALALNYGDRWNAESTEPYMQLASAVMILGLAIWMFFRTRREVAEAAEHEQALKADAPTHAHSHDHHGHSHSHAPEIKTTQNGAGDPGGLILPAGGVQAPGNEIALPAGFTVRGRTARARGGPHNGTLVDTGHGWLEVSICKDGAAPRFQIHPCKATGETVRMPRGTQMRMETSRLDGSTQKFLFEAKPDCWEATAPLPEPHEFMAVLTMGHDDHAHTYRLRFQEAPKAIAGAAATDAPKPVASVVVEEPQEGDTVYQDAHERAHAEDIAKRFANRAVTTPQIILFGVTGGLMPCPAAFTILLVCLQIKRATLGFTMVAAFSFGLALTMVFTGVLAAWSVKQAQKRFTGFGEWMRRAPFISCALLIVLASFMAWQGWNGLHHGGHPH